MKVTCRCPAELAGVLPPPIPAREALPLWLRAMPARAAAGDLGGEIATVKQCPPFVDAMGLGILVPLPCDLVVERGRFAWDWDLPATGEGLSRSPLSFHVPEQALGSPLYDPATFILKLTGFWTIATEPGVAILVTHPLNRHDLPFVTLSGLVDTDAYGDGLIHFPALWRDRDFSGRLPAGTPVAQCIPVRRTALELVVEPMDMAARARFEATRDAVATATGTYRKAYRAGSG